MKFILWLGLAVVVVAVLFLLLCRGEQDKEPPKEAPVDQMDASGLFPGEMRDRLWPVPILAAVRDTTCSIDTNCASQALDCITKTFTVQKDTLYFLTTSYFNGDTINASCRACGVVYEDTTTIMEIATACPTGGPWVASTKLKKGHTYTLSVCLQRCPQFPDCRCGERVFADAVVSIRSVFD